jgi:hypothetical protein
MSHYHETSALWGRLRELLDRGDCPADAAEVALQLALYRAHKGQFDGNDGALAMATTVVRNVMVWAVRHARSEPEVDRSSEEELIHVKLSRERILHLATEALAHPSAFALSPREVRSLILEVVKARGMDAEVIAAVKAAGGRIDG